MNEFLLLFRRDLINKDAQPSPQQMQDAIKRWQDWMGSIAAQNKLVGPPHRLDSAGRVIRPQNVVTNGPYAEIKESLGGFIVVRVDTYDEAAEIAKGCPVLEWGGSVEVRMALAADEKA